jgi:FAD/FMN-containing dehydrogenase
MEPYATGGVYVNFLHNDDGEDRIRAAYGARYDRLAKIKAQYDPENIFRSNQNIRPSRTGPSGR